MAAPPLADDHLDDVCGIEAQETKLCGRVGQPKHLGKRHRVHRHLVGPAHKRLVEAILGPNGQADHFIGAGTEAPLTAGSGESIPGEVGRHVIGEFGDLDEGQLLQELGHPAGICGLRGIASQPPVGSPPFQDDLIGPGHRSKGVHPVQRWQEPPVPEVGHGQAEQCCGLGGYEDEVGGGQAPDEYIVRGVGG